ncbi:hypothetical protein ACHAXT_012311 [Thalassiosira profunda]
MVALVQRRAGAAAAAVCRRRRYHASSAPCTAADPLTDGGTVEATFLFHRHGDRAPNRYLGAPSYLSAEAKHWRGRIPGPDAREGLSQFFPPQIHESQNGGQYLDTSRAPFGFLTYRGMDQMRRAGRAFRARYARFGRRLDGGDGRDAKDALYYSLLDHWDVRAYSTNYLRTVMSVQCFLDGLIGRCPDDNNVNSAVKGNGIHVGGGLERYYRDAGRIERWAHSDLALWTQDVDLANADEGVVRVQVRDKEIDTLNAFDRHPRMMNDLVKDVIATDDFQRIDGNAKQLADTLSTYLPGLRGAPQAFGGTPSGINWVHANDHFVCRRAHGIPLSAFSEHEGEATGREVEAALAAMAVPVCSHLAWRFREWYRCPRLLAAIAGPPFREMMGIMAEAATSLGSGDRRPFVLYSAHDVTLVALLYAIGADFLVSAEDCGGAGMQEEGIGTDTHSSMNMGSVGSGRKHASWRWWPAYSSTIAFELVRLNKESSADEYAIRVVLNGEAVRLIPRMNDGDECLIEEQPLQSRQVFGERSSSGQNKMMTLSEFESVIRVLESQGGNVAPTEDVDTVLKQMYKIGVEGG